MNFFLRLLAGSSSLKLSLIFKTIALVNHRMVEVGRDLWRSSALTPLLKQAHLQPVAQDHVRMVFEYL